MMSNGSAKQVILAIVSILVILASLCWIYFTQFASAKINVSLHTAVGQVMAEETDKLLGHKGEVIVLALDAGAAPELPAQLKSFKETLRKLGGVTIRKTDYLKTDNQPKYGTGRGLSARQFLRVVKKSAGAGAIVSFVGAPNLSDADFSELEKNHPPKFIAEGGSAAKLKKLFDKKLLQVAIVHRYQFPAPNTNAPATPREWFDKRFQILTSENAATLQGQPPD